MTTLYHWLAGFAFVAAVAGIAIIFNMAFKKVPTIQTGFDVAIKKLNYLLLRTNEQKVRSLHLSILDSTPDFQGAMVVKRYLRDISKLTVVVNGAVAVATVYYGGDKQEDIEISGTTVASIESTLADKHIVKFDIFIKDGEVTYIDTGLLDMPLFYTEVLDSREIEHIFDETDGVMLKFAVTNQAGFQETFMLHADSVRFDTGVITSNVLDRFRFSTLTDIDGKVLPEFDRVTFDSVTVYSESSQDIVLKDINFRYKNPDIQLA